VFRALPADVALEVARDLGGLLTVPSLAVPWVMKLPYCVRQAWIATLWPKVDLTVASLTCAQWMNVISTVALLNDGVSEFAPSGRLGVLHLCFPSEGFDALVNRAYGHEPDHRKCMMYHLDNGFVECGDCHTPVSANAPFQVLPP
jgi:hypothetical protein